MTCCVRHRTTIRARISSLQQLQELRQTADRAEADAQKLEDALSLDDTSTLLAWRAALPERATVEQLETLLAHERDALAEARNSAATLDARNPPTKCTTRTTAR